LFYILYVNNLSEYLKFDIDFIFKRFYAYCKIDFEYYIFTVRTTK